MVDKCIENNNRCSIKDKGHVTKLKVHNYDVVPLFGLPVQKPGPFLNKRTEYFKFWL